VEELKGEEVKGKQATNKVEWRREIEKGRREKRKRK
jgi:hypothetical protein